MRVMAIKPIAKAPRSFPKRSPPDSRIMQIKTCTQLVSRPPIIRNLQRRLPKKCPKLRREAFEIRDLWPFSATVVNAGFEKRKIWGGKLCCNVMRVRKGSFLKNGSGNRENVFFNSRIVIWVIVPRFENHFTAVRCTGQVLREGAAIKTRFLSLFQEEKGIAYHRTFH